MAQLLHILKTVGYDRENWPGIGLEKFFYWLWVGLGWEKEILIDSIPRLSKRTSNSFILNQLDF